MEKILPGFLLILCFSILIQPAILNADTNNQPLDQMALDIKLIDAAKKSETKLVKKLLELGADSNVVDKESGSALWYAICFKNSDIVKLLIDSGLNLKNNARFFEYSSRALYNFDLKTIKYLVKGGMDVNGRYKNKHTMLMSLCSSEYGYKNNPVAGLKIVEYLISKGAKINLPIHKDYRETHTGYTLCRAILCDDPALIKVMLNANADPNARFPYYDAHTPLMFVVENSFLKHGLEIMKLLIKHGADVNLKLWEDNTVLHYLLKHSNPNMEYVDLLLKSGATVDEKVLSIVAQGGNLKLFQRLNKTSFPAHFNELLISLAAQGNIEAIDTILKNNPNDTNCKYDQALYAAAKNGYFEIVKLLLDKGGDPNFKKGIDQTPVLTIAAENGHFESVKLLVNKGADVNGVNEHSKTALISAAEKGHAAIVRFLIDKGADINHKENYHRYRTPLLSACYYGHLETVKILIEKGADIAIKDSNNITPMRSAITDMHYDIVRYLIKENSMMENFHEDFLILIHSLAEDGEVKLLQMLLEKYPRFRKQKYIGPALILACRNVHFDIVKLLFNYKPYMKKYGGKALYEIASTSKNNSFNITRLLLEHKAPTDYQDEKGYTPLLEACGNRYDKQGKIAQLILKFSPRVDVYSIRGVTPLMAAVDNGRENLVKALIKKGADVNFQLSAMDQHKLFRILQYNINVLKSQGLKKHKEFTDAMRQGYKNSKFLGETALLYAVREKNNKITELLLDNGAAVNARNANGDTPLILALEANNHKIVLQLIKKGADIDAVNKRGITPLMAAARAGHASMVKLLLDNNADPDMISKPYNSKTALMYAVSENHIDVVKVLLQYSAKTDIKNKLGYTAMDYAESNQIKLLLLKKEQYGDVLIQTDLDKQLTSISVKHKKKQVPPEETIKMQAKDIAVYQFFDPFGEPFEGLKIDVEYDGKKEVKTTDKNGRIFIYHVKDKKSIKLNHEFTAK